MALNLINMDGWHISVVCSAPTVPVSGDPVRFGNLTGVALTTEAEGQNATGYTTVDFGPRVWDLSVKAVNAGGNSAVAVGDAIFYVDGDAPPLSKKVAGYFFGTALETITSGSTDTIRVQKGVTPAASGTIGAGGITSTELASDSVTTVKILNANVTAAKLTTTLATGFINLPLANIRIVASNDVGVVGATDGGLVSKDTAPILERVNGATDKCLRLKWAASVSTEVILGQFAYPPDLDDTAAVVVNLLLKSGGATDTPTCAVGYFENVGDTNAGGNTAALSSAIVQKTVTITGANIGAYPATASMSFTPGTHTTDTVELYGAWIEYTRK